MKKLRDLRKRRRWSQEYVARQIGVSLTAYNNWETGKTLPRSEHLIELANLYSVSVDYILGRQK